MSDFCTVTPDRGDRPEFLSFCKHQITRLSVQPAKSYFVTYPPKDSLKDLVPRIQLGLRQAAADGFDKVYILESDDFYPYNYFEKLPSLDTVDFVGSEKSRYYNLKNNSYQTLAHPGRSSLYCTGFRISALKKFLWPAATDIFLDLKLWKFASKSGAKINLANDSVGIGIKHGVGLCGGKGHSMSFETKDPDRTYLKFHVDQEAYAFYQTLNV